MNPQTQMQQDVPVAGGVVAEAIAVEVAPETEDQIAARKKREEERIARLDSIGFSLEGMKETAIRYRLDFEQEWVEAHHQYDEGDTVDGNQRGTREFPADRDTPDYRRTKDNITRPAVLMVTSRVADMLFPTSDRNWDLTASPDAEVPEQILTAEIQLILARTSQSAPPPAPPVAEPGQPAPPAPPEQLPPTIEQLTYDQRQSLEQRVAEERCNRMRTRIDDQLQESSYAAHGRDAISDAVLYGTGVIKGPFARSRRARMYDPATGRWEARYVPTPSPAVGYVDLFNFYPMPCRRIGESPGAFELHLSTPEMLRKLQHQPGFDRNQIARVLRDNNRNPGSLTTSILYRVGVTSRNGTTASLLDNRYAVWEFHGSLPKQGIVDFIEGLLSQQGVTPDVAAAIIGEVDDDPMIEVNCECWMVNGIVIKLALEPARNMGCMYHVYNYEERPDTLFGKGVPRVMRDDQLATTQLWQAMMLNAMMSAGLQIGVIKGGLEPIGPQGGQYDMTCTRPRVWAFTSEVDDIRKAFQAFEVPSVIDSLMPLYERSKKNSEEHIVMPSIVQGEPSQGVPTSSGLAMLMNAGNIVTRRLAKGYDDNVTTSLISSYFEWNMDHGPEEIKGDYIVVPRGSSHLLVKDVQSQRFLFALQTYSANPKLEAQMKWEEWGRQGLTIMDLDANRLLYSADEQRRIEEERARNPPVNPQEITAQARMMDAKTNASRAQSQVQLDQQREAVATQLRRDELATRLQIAQLNATTSLAQLDAKERAEVAKLAQQMNIEGMWARMEAGKMAQTERRDALEVRVEAPDPRLA